AGGAADRDRWRAGEDGTRARGAYASAGIPLEPRVRHVGAMHVAPRPVTGLQPRGETLRRMTQGPLGRRYGSGETEVQQKLLRARVDRESRDVEQVLQTGVTRQPPLKVASFAA